MSKNLKIALIVAVFWVLAFSGIILVIGRPEIASLFCGGVAIFFAIAVVTTALVAFLNEFFR